MKASLIASLVIVVTVLGVGGYLARQIQEMRTQIVESESADSSPTKVSSLESKIDDLNRLLGEPDIAEDLTEQEVDFLIAGIRDRRQGDVEGAEGGSEELAKLRLLEERLEEMASQIYDFEQETRRDLMRLQTNVLRRISQISAPAKSGVPEDPVELKEALKKEGIEINQSAKWFRFKATVINPRHPIEAICVLAGGPVHEALFLTEVQPSAMRKALRALGAKQGGGYDHRRKDKKPHGAPLFIYVEWKGQKRAWRLADIVRDVRDDTAMTEANWVFAGSRYASDIRSGQEFYVPDASRIAMSLVYKYSNDAVITSNHADAAQERIWAPNREILPEDLDEEIVITVGTQKLEHLEWR